MWKTNLWKLRKHNRDCCAILSLVLCSSDIINKVACVAKVLNTPQASLFLLTPYWQSANRHGCVLRSNLKERKHDVFCINIHIKTPKWSIQTKIVAHFLRFQLNLRLPFGSPLSEKDQVRNLETADMLMEISARFPRFSPTCVFTSFPCNTQLTTKRRKKGGRAFERAINKQTVHTPSLFKSCGLWALSCNFVPHN